MTGRHHPLIAKEIWAVLILLSISAIGLIYFALWWLVIPLLAIMLLLAYLYRDPNRKVPSRPLAVITPMDATVSSINQVNNPFIEMESVCITLNVNWLGVNRMRSPTEGKVLQNWLLMPGDVTPVTEESVKVMQIAYQVQTDEHDDVIVCFRKSNKLFSPQCEARVGERIGQGQRCGIMPMGGYIDVYLPLTAILEVEQGDRLKSGCDVLAEFRH